MTGAYLKIKRNGRFEAVEVEHLTKPERREVLKTADKEELHQWLDAVCRELAQVEPILDELVVEGVITKM